MTTVQDLIDLVEHDPDSTFFAEMLVEYLVCDCDYQHTEAIQKVNRVRIPLLAALRLTEATQALAAGGAFRGRILGRIRKVLDSPDGWRGAVLVIEGAFPPHALQDPDGERDVYWTRTCVTVGAEWILETQRTIRDEWVAKRDAMGDRKKR